MLNWLKEKWHDFEVWFGLKLPGWKTKIIALFGAIGSAALVLQEYVSQLPIGELVSSRTMALVAIILFSLSYWTKRLSDKVEVKAVEVEKAVKVAKEQVKEKKKELKKSEEQVKDLKKIEEVIP